MKTLHITGIIDAGSDSYDPDNPTKQTELLSLSLRKCLYALSEEGESPLVLDFLPEEADEEAQSLLLDTLSTDMGSIVELVEAQREAFFNEDDLPAIPEAPGIIAILLPLLPALLSGAISLPAVIPVILPQVLRFLLQKGINDLFSGDNSGLNGIQGYLSAIRGAIDDARESIREDITANTETIIAGYNSCSDAIAELQELKQVCIMRTTEIDKVILQEPI